MFWLRYVLNSIRYIFIAWFWTQYITISAGVPRSGSSIGPSFQTICLHIYYICIHSIDATRTDLDNFADDAIRFEMSLTTLKGAIYWSIYKINMKWYPIILVRKLWKTVINPTKSVLKYFFQSTSCKCTLHISVQYCQCIYSAWKPTIKYLDITFDEPWWHIWPKLQQSYQFIVIRWL